MLYVNPMKHYFEDILLSSWQSCILENTSRMELLAYQTGYTCFSSFTTRHIFHLPRLAFGD